MWQFFVRMARSSGDFALEGRGQSTMEPIRRSEVAGTAAVAIGPRIGRVAQVRKRKLVFRKPRSFLSTRASKCCDLRADRCEKRPGRNLNFPARNSCRKFKIFPSVSRVIFFVGFETAFGQCRKCESFSSASPRSGPRTLLETPEAIAWLARKLDAFKYRSEKPRSCKSYKKKKD